MEQLQDLENDQKSVTTSLSFSNIQPDQKSLTETWSLSVLTIYSQQEDNLDKHPEQNDHLQEDRKSFNEGSSESPQTNDAQKMIVCPKNKDLIVFSIICASFALFIMIGFYTFFGRNNHDIATMIDQPMKTHANLTNGSCPVDLDLIGDGYCDDEVNIEECWYDSGDCCAYENDRSQCEACSCYVDSETSQVNANWLCYNESVLVSMRLGDGDCDLTYNIPEYLFDVGDCCLSDYQTGRSCILMVESQNPFANHGELEPVRIDCPTNACVFPSNTYSIDHELGDGICQVHNNGELCDFDLGDCCLSNRWETSPDCHCPNDVCFCKRLHHWEY